MKKLVILVATFMLLIVSGCSADPNATVSNGSEPIMTVDDRNFTRSDYYNAMIANNASSFILNQLTDMIYNEKVEEKEEDLIKRVDEEIEEFKTEAADYLDLYLYYYGYSSIDDYRNAMISYYKMEAIEKIYLNDNYDQFVSKYNPRKAKILEFENSEQASAALQQIKDGKSFEDVKIKATTRFDGTEMIIYYNASAFDTSIINLLTSYKEPAIVEEIVTKSTTDAYYVIEFTNCDPNSFKDEFIELIINNTLVKDTDVLAEYAKAGNFAIYDEAIYNEFKESYPNFFK